MPFIKWGENMEDRDVQFPNRYRVTKVPGTDDIYDLIPAPGEIQNEGTLINKSTLLTDAVASMFDFGASAVPNDMFNVLTHAGDLHVWKRVKITGESTYTLVGEQIGNKILSNQNDTIGGMTWHYSSSVLVSSSGDISLVNEETITVNQNTVANGQNLVGKFAYPEKTGSGFSAGAVVFFPSNAVVTYTNGWTQISKYQSVTVVPPGTYIDYPVHPNRNAYQEGTVGDTTIEYMGQLGSKARIETGTYIGNGTYGQSTPNSLTIGFVPKILLIECKPNPGTHGLLRGIFSPMVYTNSYISYGYWFTTENSQ